MAWLRRLALAFVALAVLAACDSPEERVAKHYARAMELIAASDYSRATLELRNALKLDENHAPSRLEIARIYERQGEMRAAVANYRLVAELDPQNVESRLKLAQIYLLGNALDEAATMIDAAVKLAPGDPDVLATSASISYRQGDAATAIALARRALEIAPANPTANALLITDRVSGGDRAGGLEEIDRLLADAPADLILNMLKLRILSSDEDDPALGAHLRRLIELFPEQARFREALVQWQIRRGDVAGAEHDLRALADAAPGDAAPTLRLARFLLGTKGEDAARAELAARSAAAPDAATGFAIRAALADLDFAGGRRDEARAAMRDIIAAEGDSVTGQEARVRLARYEMAENQRDAAADLVETVLKADPQNVEALGIRAEIRIAREQPADAILDLRKALDLDPQNVGLMLLEARAHERNGSPALAGERLATAARDSNFAPDVALAYARFLNGQGRPEAAETVLTEAVQRNRGNRVLLASLAEARLRLKNWDGAEEVAKALARLDNGETAAGRVRAAALSGQGRLSESIDALQRLTDDPDTDQGAMAQLIAAYIRAGELDKAEAFLDDTLAREPKNLRALLLRAEIHLQRRDPESAAARLREIIDIAPDAPTGHLGLARLRVAQGQPAEAERIVREAIGHVKPDDALRLMLAGLLENRGAFDEAIAQYATLYEAQPDAAVVANNYASLLAEHHADDPARLEEARRIAQRLRISDVPQFQDTYGWIRFLSGEPEEALRSLIPAAEALPRNAYVRFHLGATYAALGRTAEARENLEAALAADAEFAMADAARAALAQLPPAPPR